MATRTRSRKPKDNGQLEAVQPQTEESPALDMSRAEQIILEQQRDREQKAADAYRVACQKICDDFNVIIVNRVVMTEGSQPQYFQVFAARQTPIAPRG